MDDGESKRRKIGSEEGGRDGGGGDGADEEEKMERFFTLIQSTKDILQSVARETRERARPGEGERTRKVEVWTPTFRPEDFAGDESPSGSVSGVQAGPSNTKEEEEEGKAKREKQKEDNDLDLKLSL